MDLTSNNQFSTFIDEIWIVQVEILKDGFINNRTMLNEQSDLCFGVGGVDRLTSRSR